MPTTRMASEPAEQRTPLRAVQPDAVAAHEGEAVALEAKPVGGVIAGENDENFDSVRMPRLRPEAASTAAMAFAKSGPCNQAGSVSGQQSRTR